MKKLVLIIVLSLFMINVVNAEEVLEIVQPTDEVEVIEEPVVNETTEVVVEESVGNTGIEEKDEDASEGVKEEVKEDNKESENDKKAVSARDIISLIISFMVLGVVIGAGIFAYKENKEFNNKK